MKKFVKVISALLVLAALCTVFASCGKKLSGEYYMGDKTITKSYTSYTFSGSKVTVLKTGELLGQSSTTEIVGKYEITEAAEGYEITFTFETADDDVKSGTYKFEEGDGFIKIGGIKYDKAEN